MATLTAEDYDPADDDLTWDTTDPDDTEVDAEPVGDWRDAANAAANVLLWFGVALAGITVLIYLLL